MCPAYNLAMKEVAAALANLVHGFTWRLPDGVAPEDLSMEEFFGLTMSMKVPSSPSPSPGCRSTSTPMWTNRPGLRCGHSMPR